ncbi:MAG: YbhN family protein [Acidimicrobiales bacterium]
MTVETQRKWAERPLARLLKILGILFVVNTFVLPQLAGTRDALALVGDLDPRLLAGGLAAEILSLASVSHLIRTLLPESSRPPSWTVQRIVLAARAASRVVPGGAAAGGVLSYRLLRRVGVPTSEAGFSVGTQSLESAVVLIGIMFVALLVSVPLTGFNAAYLAVTVVGLMLLTTIGALVLAITRGGDRSIDFSRRFAQRMRVLDPDAVEGQLRSLGAQLRDLATDRRELVRHVGWSAAYWLFDALALWVFLAAFGHWTRVDGLLVAFGLANVLATLPITPGGLGVVEVTLAASLTGFGVPSGIALLGVVSWRLVNYWIPIPMGAAAYLSLKLGRPGQAGADALQDLTREARVEAEETLPWRWGRARRSR